MKQNNPKKQREIDVLRAEYAKMEKKVNAKIRRNLKKRIIVAGTVYDPRLKPDHLKKLNRKQLAKRIEKMQEFVSPKLQFIGGAGGKAISKRAYTAYVANVKDKNANLDEWWDQVKELPSWRSSYTVGEYVAARRLPHPGMAGNPHHALAPEPILKPHQVKDPSALDQHLKLVEKRMSKSYVSKVTKSDWKAATDMARYTVGVDLLGELRQLSEGQFMALWNYSSFANSLSMMYEIAKDYLTKGKMSKMREELFLDAYGEGKDQIKWALGLDI